MSSENYTLPADLAAVHERIIRRRMMSRQFQRECANRAEQGPMLVGDTWVTAPHLASALGLTREIIYNNLDLFTTRQGDDYNAPHQVKVDKRVQQFIDERYLGVKVI